MRVPQRTSSASPSLRLVNTKEYELCGKYLDPKKSLSLMITGFRQTKRLAEQQQFGARLLDYAKKSSPMTLQRSSRFSSSMDARRRRRRSLGTQKQSGMTHRFIRNLTLRCKERFPGRGLREAVPASGRDVPTPRDEYTPYCYPKPWFVIPKDQSRKTKWLQRKRRTSSERRTAVSERGRRRVLSAFSLEFGARATLPIICRPHCPGDGASNQGRTMVSLPWRPS